jgi:hypothetical protein
MGDVVRAGKEPPRTESEIKRDILVRLGSRADIRIWNNPTGVARSVDGEERVMRFGVPGQADLTGVLPGGRRLELEVKTPVGRQSEQQRKFEAMVRRFGGLYLLVRSSDDALAQLRAHGYCAEGS